MSEQEFDISLINNWNTVVVYRQVCDKKLFQGENPYQAFHVAVLDALHQNQSWNSFCEKSNLMGGIREESLVWVSQ
jgi:hypothetical protein